MSAAEDWAKKYNMKPHPEEIAVITVMKRDEFSAFHKVDMDEMFHYYYGKDLEVVEINPETNEISKHFVGVHHPQATFQYTVPKGHWFASRPHQSDCQSSDDYTLVGITCSPGFDFKDFYVGTRDYLLKEFPEHEIDILSLTRPSK